MKQFYNVLVNTLIANVTTSYLWFALTFWVYLETRSVMATAIIGGSYMLFVAIGSLIWGTFVDRHKKKNVMLVSSLITFAMYVLAGIVFILFPHEDLTDWRSLIFWVFTGIILLGGVVENMRNIALSTVVTILVPKETRDKANGLVGTVQGVGFMVTSVFSGLSIGLLGMGWTLVIAIAFTALALIHLFFVKINEKGIVHDPELDNKRIDIKGGIAALKAVPGLVWLVIFTTFNNLVGGVYIALMDPYGLTLFSVEMWGIILGITSTGFIIGGIIVASKGLGKNPLRTMLILNIFIAIVGMVFAIREIWWLYAVGIFAYMCLFPGIEASEQTIIQRVVPLNRQGRVFGLAMSIESAASPLSAFMIGPIAEFIIIPYMRTTEGQQSFDLLLGQGEARGIALVFFGAGLIMLGIVTLAFFTKAYRRLSAFYVKS